MGDGAEAGAIALILLMVIAFSTLSFMKPDIPIFEDASGQASGESYSVSLA